MSKSHTNYQGGFIMLNKASEKGQALILITLAAIGLFAFAALAIDGSRAFSNKRHAQNAADTSALAGALAYAREGKVDNIETVALARAKSNGYENISGDTSTVVTVTVTDVPEEECPGDATGKDITVTIESQTNTTFSKVIKRDKIESGATATSRACGYKLVPLFDGHAVVGLNNTRYPNCALAFDTGNSSSVTWRVEGSGIFSNSCAFSKEDDTVTFDPGLCVSTVGGVDPHSEWNCTPKPAVEPYDWDDYVLAHMPPDPCDGTPGDIGKAPPPMGSTFKDGVYCISNLDAYTQQNITLDNATLYVTDDEFSLRYSGNAGEGGLFGTPTRAGSYPGSEDYDNYYMIVEPVEDPSDFCEKLSDNHAQVLEWKGNGEGSFYGTVFAPSACLDLRGNADGEALHSQIIGWIVGSNGTADMYVNYKAEENHRIPYHPNISLLE
jgi:Flp pilus assembly protein TadG